MVHVEHTDKVIDGLHLVFVELPKFNPHTFSEKKMHVLWLRYMTEINEQTREIPEELLENPEVQKAVKSLEESAFTEAQLAGYEKFWDTISVEKTLISGAEKKGIIKGRKEGLEKGREEGEAIGEQKKAYQIARQMKAKGYPVDAIAELTALTEEEIDKL